MQYATSFSIKSHLRMDKQIKRVNLSFFCGITNGLLPVYFSNKAYSEFYTDTKSDNGAIPLGEDTYNAVF